MRRGLIQLILPLLLTGPLAAHAMTPDQCDRGWQAIIENTDISELDDAVAHSVDADGWCMAQGGPGPIEGAAFAKLRWRADDIESAITLGVPPRRFQVVLDGLDVVETFDLKLGAGTSPGPGALHLDVAHDPDAREGRIERLHIEMGNLGQIMASAAAKNINLSSQSASALTLGSARLQKLHVTLENTGFLSRAMLPSIDMDAGDLRERLNALIAVLPEETFEPGSLTALEAMLNDLPRARGTLRILAQSENGLGLPQVAFAAAKLEDGPPLASPEARDALALMLDGVRFNITWSPE